MVEGARLEIAYPVLSRIVGSNPTRSAKFMVSATPDERLRRDEVVARVYTSVRENSRIQLPPFDPSLDCPSDQFALMGIGLEPNDFAGAVGEYRYLFEGEEDLLHLLVSKSNFSELSVSEGQSVAEFLLPDLPTALIWLKAGRFSQHFYFGHDELLRL